MTTQPEGDDEPPVSSDAPANHPAPRQYEKRRLLSVAGGLLLLAGLGAVGYLLWPADDDPAPPVVLDRTDVQGLTADLDRGTVVGASESLTPDQVANLTLTAVPEGATLTILQDTSVLLDDDTATVQVTISGPVDATAELWLTRDFDGSWRIAGSSAPEVGK